MPDASTQDNNSAVRTARDAMLGEIGAKWGKVSMQELSALETNGELVTRVVARYGIETIAARRDADALLAGRAIP